MMGFLERRDHDRKKKDKEKRMSDQLAKQVQLSGTKISKDKLIEAIRKSPQKEFSFSQSQGSKTLIIQVQI